MTERKSFMKGALTGALAVICAGTIGIGGYRYLGDRFPWEEERVAGQQTEAKLKELRALIDSSYLREEEIDKKALEEGIYKGYVAALGDPYSVYYDAEQTKALLERTSGKFAGLGATMSQDKETGIITVKEIQKNSPAEKSGVQEEDILYKVEGQEVTGRDLSEVVDEIHGDVGTKVHLSFLRGEAKEEVEITAVREMIQTETVRHEMKTDSIGYLRITEFDEVTYDQFMDAKRDLEAQGMKGLVVDLRGNPGGNLNTVTDILNELLPKGLIVYTEDRDGKKEEIWSEGKTPLDIPCAVLVDGASASASEIFTGAMQDYGLAEIVGTTTYGKGVVQQLYQLRDGTIAKLTIAEYFTAKGRDINGVGIDPDVEIKYEPDAQNPEADNQLEKALEVVKERLGA